MIPSFSSDRQHLVQARPMLSRQPKEVEDLAGVREYMLLSDKDGPLVESSSFPSTKTINSKSAMLAAIFQNGSNFIRASEELCRDRDLVRAALLRSGLVLRNVSVELQNDWEMALIAVWQNPEAIAHVGKQLTSDRDFMKYVVSKNGLALKYASDVLKADEEIALTAVSKCEEAFKHISEALKHNKNFVMKAIKQDKKGALFYYAHKIWRADRDVVLLAVGQKAEHLDYVSYDLQNDKEVVLAAVSQNPSSFGRCALTSDRDVAMAAVSKNGLLLAYVSCDLRCDAEIVLKAASHEVGALNFADFTLLRNKEFALRAISINYVLMRYFSELYDDPIIAEAINQAHMRRIKERRF